jgi:hypothetical protein
MIAKATQLVHFVLQVSNNLGCGYLNSVQHCKKNEQGLHHAVPHYILLH